MEKLDSMQLQDTLHKFASLFKNGERRLVTDPIGLFEEAIRQLIELRAIAIRER